MDMNDYMERSTVLVEALPYIQKYYGKTVVIKYGGNAMISEELRSAVISDIILLHLVGVKVVMVHGGGPEIGGMLQKIGKQSRFVDGLRYTDEETMDVVQQVLCGKVNKHLVSIINNLGGKAIGLCGLDGALFQAKKLDEKYGLVGKIVKVEPQVVHDALNCGYIPVVSTVALGIDNDTAYNINADTAAAELAISLGAEKLILLTDVQAAFDGDPAAQSKEEIIFSYPGFFAIFVYRIAHELYVQDVPLIPRIMSEYAHGRTGVDINSGATIGEYFFIDHATGVVIGETTTIGNHVKIYQGVTLGALSTRAGQALSGVKRHPTIEDDVTIYSNASVLGGETVIGEGSIIAGSAFVISSVPAGSRVSLKNQEVNVRTPNKDHAKCWEI